jgi:hypothetical protein
VNLGLGLRRRLGLGDRVNPGGGLVGGVSSAIGRGRLLGQGGDHRGDRSVLEVGRRLGMRGQELDDLADLAVLVDNGLAVGTTAEMPVELGPLGGGQIAPDEVEGLRVGQLDVPLRKHRRHPAGWPARPATCLLPWPSGI